MVIFFFKRKDQNMQDEKCDVEARFLIFLEREREHLLSRFPVNRTVGFLRSKKESRSTRRGQHVGTGFLEFRKNP